MIGALVAWSLRHRLLVVLGVLALVAAGVRAYVHLPIDAVPDITNVQVQVLTNAPGLSPIEVEQLVTRPIELKMAGLPGATAIRSTSRSSVSAITIVFRDDVPLSEARTLVAQRIASASEAIPPSAHRPELGPMSTGLGEVFHFTMHWPEHSASELRTIFDWEVAQALRQVPGVVEVNAWGGITRQVEVRLRQADLMAHGISAEDVEECLLGAGASAGGGALERDQEQILVRFDGQFRTVDDVAGQVIRQRPGGMALVVRDVADVRDGAAFRSSAATADGDGETVYAMAQMIAGGNAHQVVPAVEAKLGELARRLPQGLTIRPFYARTRLVDAVLATVKRSLGEGGAIVLLVLYLLLGNAIAALVVATAIPLSMLGAFVFMDLLGLSGNLMSLGAIDFGLVVDGAVVVVEGALTAMAHRHLSTRDALEEEGHAVGGPIAFGVLIIGLVYVPILSLEGVEGKMFRPMAWTVLFALGTALILSFTWIPVALATFLRRPHDKESWIVHQLRRGFDPFMRMTTAHPSLAVLSALALVAGGVGAGWNRGAEFVPRLEEGDLVIQVTRPPSVSLHEAIVGTSEVESTLRKFPEVVRVVSRTGSPDVATDIMGIEQSDVFVMLAPPSSWTSAPSREGLIAKFETELRKKLPGTLFSFTQPIEMRSQELLGGLKTDFGVKIFGSDIDELAQLSEKVQQALGAIEGASDVRAEPISGLLVATVRPRPERMGAYGVKPEELRRAVETLRSGRTVGTLVEGERRFDVVVRTDTPPEPTLHALRQSQIVLKDGHVLPLVELAEVDLKEGPAQFSREGGRRRVLVEANVRGRDLATFVGDAEKQLAKVSMPPGYFFSFAGQYENLTRAALRLSIVIPVTLLGIFLLLYVTFGRALPAALVFANIPAAASGGVLALAARDMPFSISAGVGLIALFGVATLNGIVLIVATLRQESAGLAPKAAAFAAARDRLRPVATTAIVATMGFVPMAMATGTGAEVQRPLATVVIGGILTATFATLAILPTVYGFVHSATMQPNPHVGDRKTNAA